MKGKTMILLCDSRHGVYIPQIFAETINKDLVSGVNEEQWSILESGPDHEFYWDVMCEVQDFAIIKDSEDREYFLYLDSDLWAVSNTDAFDIG